MDLEDKTRFIQENVGTTPDGIWGSNTADAVIAALGLDLPAEPDMWFGGVAVQPLGGWYEPALATTFGSYPPPLFDPADSGQSAFGGPTGPSGREGVAVPQNILEHLFPGSSKSEWPDLCQVEAETTDGVRGVFDLADLGPGESIWERNGQAVLDCTYGTIIALGGSILSNSNNEVYGFSGFTLARFRVLKKRNIC